MQGSFLRLLVVLLCFSSLIGLNAIPTSRTRNLMLQAYQVSGYTHLENIQGLGVIRRMDVALNDYAGSGPNNRHTPTPKLGK
ncbi:hypothetical protein Vadar_034044 [Vaccinium darrowii]|uniref:Uncharacterized protein n=1 Tax=Vaccinium darrowii TaxID=229202 RepID=A0ACB7Z1D4_9ERIC|nr:hypothetical protein Vadar_034044 [Vaccinium darrowii]